jgi:drug/metabolite transporter (DMT)-like permease
MNTNTKAYLALFSGLSFMCFAAIFIKSAHAPGIVTAFYRMAIGALVLTIPFFISQWRQRIGIPWKGVLFAVLGGLCFATDMAFWSTGVVMSNATIPTLTANLAPLWVGFGSIIIFHQRHKPGFWVGLFVAIAGMVLLIHRDLDSNTKIGTGALMGTVAGLFYGVFYLFSQTGRKLLNTLHFLYISTLSSAVLLLVLMLVLGYDFTGYDRHTYLVFLGIGVGVQVCGWFLINYSQGYLPASTVAPTLLGQPVLTAFLAIWLLNEKLTIWHISGGLIVIAGIYIVHYSRSKLQN